MPARLQETPRPAPGKSIPLHQSPPAGSVGETLQTIADNPRQNWAIPTEEQFAVARAAQTRTDKARDAHLAEPSKATHDELHAALDAEGSAYETLGASGELARNNPFRRGRPLWDSSKRQIIEAIHGWRTYLVGGATGL